MSDVTLEVTPDTSMEYNWDTIQAQIKDLDISGVQWAPDFVLQDFVFGMKKLIVVAQIIDNMVPSTTVLTEAMLKVAGIGGAEMTNIETAANDWAKQDKKDAAKAAAAGQPSKKKKKKKSKKEAVRVIDDKMLKVAADKIIVQVKEAEYYVTGVPDVDGSGQTDTTREHLEAVVSQVRAKNANVTLMLVTAGKTNVTVLVSVPEANAEKVNATEWLNSTQVKGEGDAQTAFGALPCSIDDDMFPIKVKDIVCAEAFLHLKKLGAIKDESDDELYTFGDGADGY